MKFIEVCNHALINVDSIETIRQKGCFVYINFQNSFVFSCEDDEDGTVERELNYYPIKSANKNEAVKRYEAIKAFIENDNEKILSI